MRIAAVISASLHLGILVVFILFRPPATPIPENAQPANVPIEVELISDKTNIAPQVKRRPEPEKPPEPAPEPEKPKPQRVVEAAPPPEPAPEPAPRPIMPEPEPEPKPVEVKPEEKPKPPPKAPPKAQPKPPKKTPPKKQEDFFAQSAELLDKRPEEPEERVFQQDLEPGATFGEREIEGVGDPTAEPSVTPQARIAAIINDKIKRNRCWNPVPGSDLSEESLAVLLAVEFREDGSLLSNPKPVDTWRYSMDPLFQAHANHAIAAIRQCAPYDLPPEYYSIWARIQLNLDPRNFQ